MRQHPNLQPADKDSIRWGGVGSLEVAAQRATEPVAGSIAGPGPVAHAAFMQRGRGVQQERFALQLQQHFGNRYVQRVMALARQGEGEPDVHPQTESAIEGKRGGGQALDSGVRIQMESAMGADFQGVRVHTDSTAHSLNTALNAVAFTTGRDIFFREQAYDPHSSQGRRLLAHELTHVVQQNGAGAAPNSAAGPVQRACTGKDCEEDKDKMVQPKLVVGAPDNVFEQEADRVADQVVRTIR